MMRRYCVREIRTLYVVLIGIGLSALAPGSLGSDALVAQEARIDMDVDTTVIHMGDPVSVRLSVDHPEGWAVAWADSLAIAPFEVLRYERPAPVASPAGDGMRSSVALTVTSFELGELDIPPIAVAVTAPDGTVHTLLTDPFRIGVESIGLDESGDIRDIKGPLSIARSWWVLLLWLVLAAAWEVQPSTSTVALAPAPDPKRQSQRPRLGRSTYWRWKPSTRSRRRRFWNGGR